MSWKSRRPTSERAALAREHVKRGSEFDLPLVDNFYRQRLHARLNQLSSCFYMPSKNVVPILFFNPGTKSFVSS